MFLKSVSVVLFLLQFVKCELELPSYFPQCYRNDPNVSQCLLEATDQVREFLRKGVPELKIPVISPFHIPEVSLEQGTETMNYKAKLTNIIVKGFDTYKFSKYEASPDFKHFLCNFDVDHVDMEGDYTISGKILVLQIEGNGRFRANMSGISIDTTVDLDFVTKNNMQYYASDKIKPKMNIKSAYLAFDGLFNGDKALNELARKALDENKSVLIAEFTPAIEKVVEKLIEENVYKSVFRVSFDKLFPVK